MIVTANITGVFFAPGGAPVANADVFIVPRQKFIGSTSGAPLVPRPLLGLVTDATGQIGWLDGSTFMPGVDLVVGQYALCVRKGDITHSGVLTIDAAMVTAGAVSLADALQPAPEPELVSTATRARDEAVAARAAVELLAGEVAADVQTIAAFQPTMVVFVAETPVSATFEFQSS